MFKKLLLAIENYIKYITNIDDEKVVSNAIASFEKITFEKHREYNYDIRPRVGGVWWIDYGDNLKPELSFRHMGIIIAKKGKSFLTIPITTKRYDKPMHINAYHPTENISGKKDYYLMKASSFSFLKHDSVAKCCEPKMISIKRVYSFVYQFNQNDAFFVDLNDAIHKNFFAPYDYSINYYKKENSRLKMQLFLSSIKEQYVAKNFVDFSNQLLIPQQYEIGVNDPKKISLKTYEYKLELMDEYGQREAKTITYIIEE